MSLARFCKAPSITTIKHGRVPLNITICLKPIREDGKRSRLRITIRLYFNEQGREANLHTISNSTLTVSKGLVNTTRIPAFTTIFNPTKKLFYY
jgi:hypothetical protein